MNCVDVGRQIDAYLQFNALYTRSPISSYTLAAEALKLLVDALKERAEQQRASEVPGGKGKHFKKP